MNEAIDLSNLEPYWQRRKSISKNSGTTIDTFKPVIPWQKRCLLDIRTKFDYSIGTHEILLSGSVGSAKSLFLAHIIVSHCLLFVGACAGVFRLTSPDLKDTIFKDIVDHLYCQHLKEGRDYWVNNTRGQVHFRNGSSIITRSFSDKRYTKVRSLRLSLAVFEEFTEFKGEHEQAVKETRNRLGRLPNVPENLLIGATNPDSPDHWIYDYYIENREKHETRHVYYSLTFDNPFLPESYIKSILRNLDAKQVLRMVFGRWIELRGDVVYYEYGEYNYIKRKFKVDAENPIHISWDFNIGAGKPLSCVMFQTTRLEDGSYSYHFFNEVVVEGMRTLDSCEEIAEKGILDNYGRQIIVHGDAAGAHNDTRSKKTDYDIIMNYLQNYQREDGQKLEVMKKVPNSNPPIRTRHNKMNALFKNALGEVRIFVYSDCETLHKGFRLTKLKDKGALIEDDGPSCPFQHVTTAAGYGVIATEKFFEYEKQVQQIKRRNNGY